MCSDSSFPPSRPNVPVKRLPLRLRVKPGGSLLVSRDPEVGKEGRCAGLARGLQGRSPGHFPLFNKSKPGNTNPNARLTVCYTLEEDDQSWSRAQRIPLR